MFRFLESLADTTENANYCTVLFDFINLIQVHFTVSAQDIFTFRRLSVFTVCFTGILQVLINGWLRMGLLPP